MSFKALSQSDDKQTRAELVDMEDSALPERAVTVGLACSTLNFKDTLATTGRGTIARPRIAR